MPVTPDYQFAAPVTLGSQLVALAMPGSQFAAPVMISSQLAATNAPPQPKGARLAVDWFDIFFFTMLVLEPLMRSPPRSSLHV